MPESLFVDTSYAIALASRTDAHHAVALRYAEELGASRAPLLTTRAVLLEIGNALSRQRYRSAAIALLEALERDPQVEIVSVHDGLYQRARELFGARHDKEWGLTDCLSFVVMQDRELTAALTADDHFRQAGFKALLLEA